ncbi:MAG: hypothetical protein ACRC62_30715 [Microcoleus sp.]
MSHNCRFKINLQVLRLRNEKLALKNRDCDRDRKNRLLMRNITSGRSTANIKVRSAELSPLHFADLSPDYKRCMFDLMF